jgi:hypothetical protein
LPTRLVEEVERNDPRIAGVDREGVVWDAVDCDGQPDFLFAPALAAKLDRRSVVATLGSTRVDE